MELYDFDGRFDVEQEQQLLERLRTIRRGSDGAFILSHGADASLFVHFNDEAAFLAYFPDRDGHLPTLVPSGMWNIERADTRFLQVDGSEAVAIWVIWQQLVPLQVAYRAAVDFFHTAALPQSVTWQSL